MTAKPGSPGPRSVLTVPLECYALPSRPSGAAASVQDAYRQTAFLLASDLALFERAMNHHLRLALRCAKVRTRESAALFAFWSKVYRHLADACALLHTGSYLSCPPLLRSACDCVAAQRSLIAGGFDEYREWLPASVAQDRERAALRIEIGRFRAGSVLAQDQRLGLAYRVLTELSMPHFGSTLLQSAPGVSPQKAAIPFADPGFHLGWAELVTGWLLLLASAQAEAIAEWGHEQIGPDAMEMHAALMRDIDSALANPRRCYVEEASGAFLIHNFRRTAASAPQRILLG